MTAIKRKFIGGPWDGREVEVAEYARSLKVPGEMRLIDTEAIPIIFVNGIPQVAPTVFAVHAYEMSDDGTMNYKGKE